MKIVQPHIEDKQATYARHPFFDRLRRDAPLHEILPCTEQVAFWTLSFQDALRLNEARVEDPTLRDIVRRHRLEEGGHDHWFLTDMTKIFGSPPDLARLFGDEHQAAREAGYALLTEVMRANSDHERLLMLFVFESTGHVFFEEIAAYFSRAGIRRSLKYFAQHHIDAEQDHEVFEKDVADFIAGIELAPDQRDLARAMVDRAYVAFHRMLDAMEAIAGRQEAPSGVSAGLALQHRLMLSEQSAAVAA